MEKKLRVAQVRDLLNQLYNEKISFSRFVEILNEENKANRFNPEIHTTKSAALELAEDAFKEGIKVERESYEGEDESLLKLFINQNKDRL